MVSFLLESLPTSHLGLNDYLTANFVVGSKHAGIFYQRQQVQIRRAKAAMKRPTPFRDAALFARPPQAVQVLLRNKSAAWGWALVYSGCAGGRGTKLTLQRAIREWDIINLELVFKKNGYTYQYTDLLVNMNTII